MQERQGSNRPTIGETASNTGTAPAFGRGELIVLLAVYVIAALLMFSGDAFRDTLGVVIILIETLYLLTRDRHGLASLYGAVDWPRLEQWQRVALVVVEVLFFYFATGVYLVRVALAHRDLLMPPH